MKSKPIETSEALDKALEEIKKCEEKEQMNDEMNDKMSDEMNNEVNNMDEMNEQELNDFFGDDTDSFTDTQTGEDAVCRRYCSAMMKLLRAWYPCSAKTQGMQGTRVVLHHSLISITAGIILRIQTF